MSLRDVRKENMTGFWNTLKVKNKAYSVEKKYKSSPTSAWGAALRRAKDNTKTTFQVHEEEAAVTRKPQREGREDCRRHQPSFSLVITSPKPE